MIDWPIATSSISSSCMSAPIIGRLSTWLMLPSPPESSYWPSRSSEMKLLTNPDDRGARLDVFLAARLEHLTRSQIQMLNRSGAIRIEGRQDKAGYRIRGGETIEVDLNALESVPLTPEQIPLQIYYEDQDLAVIEKPAGLVVHPGSGTSSKTVVHGLLFHFQSLSNAGGAARPGIVHRLDKK